jgi:hypothetical protein
MPYWWVNQNQTYEQEIRGGYMWSPKRKRNGAYNQFYENMTLVQPGDIVFSFRKQTISDVGVAEAAASSRRKPPEFGSQGDYWSDEGWLVPVNWNRLEYPITPKQYLEEIRPTLPEKYSPLNAKTGDGLQSVYLASVPQAMADLLISKLGARDQEFLGNTQPSANSEQERIDVQEDEIQAAIEQDTSIDKTEIEATIKARKGQGRYRRNLELIEAACRVTRVTDKRLLRASHIKPWRLCEDNYERLDGNNGLLLSPSIDLLFDHGYISFDDDGRLLVSTRISTDQLTAIGVPTEEEFNAGEFSKAQRVYLSFHRRNVFRP